MKKIINALAKYNFNSENHLIEIIADFIGIDKATAKKEYNSLKDNNQITFEGTKVKIIDETFHDDGFNHFPKYWASTRMISDRSLRLKMKDWEIVNFILNGSKLMKDGVDYRTPDTISKSMECKYSAFEIRKTLNKLNYWFGPRTYREETYSAIAKRTYYASHSKTIDLPPKSKWKELIEKKLITVIGKADYEIPYLINDNDLKRLETINNNRKNNHKRRMSLREFERELATKEKRKSLACISAEIIHTIKREYKLYIGKIYSHFGDVITPILSRIEKVMNVMKDKDDSLIRGFYRWLKKQNFKPDLALLNIIYKKVYRGEKEIDYKNLQLNLNI